VILDGAVVGPDVVIGAGSLVKQNDIVPPGTLYLGVPAKLKRELTNDEIAAILDSARTYSQFALEYLRSGM